MARETFPLLMPIHGGDKDEYGKDVVPLPLSFDKVNEGRPPSSRSLLFQLPMELLREILQRVPADSLASLALVNRDCRQLARSRQFASRLDWEDKICLDKDFFDSVACSSIHHLKLFRIQIIEEFQIGLPERLLNRGFPLRSLHMDCAWWRIAKEEEKGSIFPLCTSILRLCAPTLGSLTWVGSAPHRDPKHPDAWNMKLPPFQNLRYLQLDSEIFQDTIVLEAMIPPEGQCRLRALAVDPESNQFSEFFKKRGKIPTLERLVWTSPSTKDYTFEFLHANDQLSTLSFLHEFSSEVLNKQILPSLSHSFTNLVSLSLTWKEPRIEKEALEYIATLTGLEQIHLSAGNQFGWRHDWLIDHQVMRNVFTRLPKLRKFAFSRDSYDNLLADSSVEQYYVEPWMDEAVAMTEDPLYELLDEDDENEESDGDSWDYLTLRRAEYIFEDRLRQSWEQVHRFKMLTEANKYLKELPNHHLEWMYFGQIPMGVVYIDGERKACLLSRQRDSCFTLLKRMFSWETFQTD
ncbi:hypothetical protein VTN00DRAFT_441 [Thermoascus crustaceus]|uniref:uncharacterized protein n=1 Tax=Thermoascus crustaceus TaxID=5088 RepID=UPI0037445793